MCDTMYQNAFGRFATMDKRVEEIMASGGTIPIERYTIMDSMMNSMDPMKAPVDTSTLNAMVDNFNIISEKEIKPKVNSSVSKMMLDVLNKELNELLISPSFDMAKQMDKVNSLMNEIKRLNMML